MNIMPIPHVATDAEVSKVVMAYRQSLVKGFNDEELEFAKAVCCLRQICAVKVRLGYKRCTCT